MDKAFDANLLKPDQDVETQELVTVVTSVFCNAH